MISRLLMCAGEGKLLVVFFVSVRTNKRTTSSSELGLAQSEIAFRQHFQHKRTVTSGTVPINHWKVCLRRKHEEGSGGRFWKLGLKTDFGILYYEDRRPLYCTTESRHTATFGLFLGLLEDRCECGRCARGCSSGDRLYDNVLFCLIAVLNRNTLVPSATRSMERGR
jgi:hypothetical protein